MEDLLVVQDCNENQIRIVTKYVKKIFEGVIRLSFLTGLIPMVEEKTKSQNEGGEEGR